MTTVEKAATVGEIATQIGSTLLPDNDQWTNRFQIKSSSSNRLYIIAQRRADGVWGCSCPGWINHRRCHHLTDVLRRLTALAEKVPAYNHMSMMVSARTAFLILDAPKKAGKKFAPAGRVLDLD